MAFLEAQRLCKLKYPCTSLSLTHADGRKILGFPRAWQKATHETSLTYYVTHEDNALAILTGDKSDILALDVDLAKPDDLAMGRVDGASLFDELVQAHGLPPEVPISQTATGGRHVLFSLTKSLSAGLHTAKNQTKLVVDGKESTLDVRGDGGCIVVYPSNYVLDGKRRQYRWITPIRDPQSLPAAPTWLIDILNGQGKRKIDREGHDRQVMSRNKSSQYHDMVKEEVNKLIPFERMWPRENGFDIAPCNPHLTCICCRNRQHDSNNYKVRRIISTCFKLLNYSNSCDPTIHDHFSVQALKDVYFSPKTDDPYVHVLQVVTQDDGHRLCYTGKEWMCFQGLYWEQLMDMEIKHRINLYVNTDVILTLVMYLTDEGKVGEARKQFRIANEYLKKSHNVSSVAEKAKQLLVDTSLPDLLDTNRDIIGCSCGVIDLRNGTIRKATSKDYLSRAVEAHFDDVARPTPLIDAFFQSIFNDDRDLITYMQRFLGYGITGHTSAQVWGIFTGVGSNGKSLLVGLLSSLLGPSMFGVPPKEVFFQSKQGQAGGHTAHLHTLRGKLMIAREERDTADQLDSALIKAMTGQSEITSRAPYSSEYVTFQPTHLAILACNHLPEIDVDDSAMLRRLVVVPFTNVYTSPTDRVPFDPENPRHRLKDDSLKDKLGTPEARTQFLTWLVRGAVAWYKDGLGEQPQPLRDCLKDYITDNDLLSQFIEGQCETGPHHKVNAAAFKAAYVDVSGKKITQKELQEAMARRGFCFKNLRCDGRMERVYTGVTFTNGSM